MAGSDLDFLKEANWPKLGSLAHSQVSKDLHIWCGKLTSTMACLLNSQHPGER